MDVPTPGSLFYSQRLSLCFNMSSGKCYLFESDSARERRKQREEKAAQQKREQQRWAEIRRRCQAQEQKVWLKRKEERQRMDEIHSRVRGLRTRLLAVLPPV